MRRKPLVFKQLDSGCIIPTSHKLNADRQQAAKEYWLSHEGTTGIALAEQFGVSFSTTNRWIRKWKVQRLSDKE